MAHTLSRRGLLKVSLQASIGLAGVALAACGGSPATSPAPSSPAASPKPSSPASAAAAKPSGAASAAAAKPSAAAAGATGADAQALAAAAKAEGKVTFYTSNETTIVDQMTKLMSEQYGVAMEAVRLNSGPLTQRLSAEMQAGKFVADVAALGDPLFAADAVKKGWFAKIDSLPGLDQWPKEYWNGYYATVSIIPMVIAWNTTIMTDKIQDWTDIVNPKWKGQMLAINAHNTGPVTLAYWNFLRKHYGDDFLRQYGALSPKLIDGAEAAWQQLAAGAGAMLAPTVPNPYKPLKDQGAPVAYFVPDAVTGTDNVAAVSAQAPHPNAAKLLLSFLISPTGQKLLNTVASSPANTPGSTPLPKKFEAADYETGQKTKDELFQLLGF